MSGTLLLVIIGAGLALVVGLVVVFIIVVYNKLVRLRVDCDNGWSQIDVQLQRRYDLIPNLVETVKGYASHEKETLDAVISARAKAVQTHDSSGQGVGDQARVEGELSQALGRLMMLSEAYPDLKANQNFAQLQEELASTENKIGFARQHYNDVVGRFETSRQSFPDNLVAGVFNFAPREYFNLENADARQAPSVSFN